MEGGDGSRYRRGQRRQRRRDLHHHRQRHAACASTASSPAPFCLDIGTTENLVAQRQRRRRRHHRRQWLEPADPTHHRRRRGQRHHHRRRRRRHAARRRRQRHSSTAAAATTRPSWVRATTPSCGTRATAATSVEGQAGARHACCSTAPTSTRRSTSRPTASGVRFTRDVANIVMDLNGVEHIDFHRAGRRRQYQ